MSIADFGQIAAIVVGSIFVIGLVIGSVYALRDRESRKAAENAADAWKDERDAAVVRADRLQAELASAKARIGVLEQKVAELESRPDLTMHAQALAKIESALHTIEMSIVGHQARDEEIQSGILKQLAVLADNQTRILGQLGDKENA